MGSNYAYVNPYYSGGYGSGYDYSQPIGTSSYSSYANDTSGTTGTGQALASTSGAPDATYANVGAGTTGTALTGTALTGTALTGTAPAGTALTGTAAIGNSPGTQPTAQQQQGLAEFDSARAAFRQGNYAQAEQLAGQAVALLPEDATVHEFRALTLFAQQKYREAAAGIHNVLTAGPGSNEETLKSLYGDPKAYADQLAALQAYSQGNPDAADAHFLLAYHELTAGQLDSARAQLEQVAHLEPKDHLAPELVQALAAPRSDESSGTTS